MICVRTKCKERQGERRTTCARRGAAPPRLMFRYRYWGRLMRFSYFTHIWKKTGMTPAQRYELVWRELQSIRPFGQHVMPALRDVEPF